MSSGRIAVCLEVTPKHAVASALDWPGWCRAGRDEGAALDAPVAGRARGQLPVHGCLRCRRAGARGRGRLRHLNAAARSRK
jgi:hypothetical protein